jgi:DNA sulfur modification protein DndD
MLLRNLTLDDFGAYRGVQSLDLTTKPGKPIVLIGGLNGCGKTTLLDAIQLVLYGPRARCSGRGSRSYDAYLRESINRRADPSRGSSLVLEFSTTMEGIERLYRVVRSWSISGKSLREFVTVMVDGVYDRAISQGWADYVEDLLPLEVASLFFFDGEKIESLADPDRAASVIESAVHSLLGVSTVEQLRTDLLALQRRQKLSDEDQAALDQIRALETRHTQAQHDVDATQQQVGAAQARLDVARATLAEADRAFEKEGGELFRQRAELESERREVGKQFAANEEALQHIAAGPLPLLLLADEVHVIVDQATQEQTAAQAAQVVDVLKNRDQWILKLLRETVPTADISEVRKELTADRKRRSQNASADRVLDLPADISAQIAALEQVLAHEHDQARKLLHRIAEQAVQLDSLDRLLAGVPDENQIADRLQQRDQAMRSVATIEAELATAEMARTLNRQRRDHIGTELERAHQQRVDSMVKAEDVSRVIMYSDRARATLEKFGEALLKRHISRLEVAVLDSFSRLMRKNRLVRDLRIDTDKFSLTLVDEDGEPLDPNRLSAGERQLLAISLLWGLARVAGNWLPSVIDTPLGRLDSRHREHLVDRYFPVASHQVLLLSTDEEIDKQLLARLKPSIAHTYTLVHDDTEFTTTIEPGYWWIAGASHVA